MAPPHATLGVHLMADMDQPPPERGSGRGSHDGGPSPWLSPAAAGGGAAPNAETSAPESPCEASPCDPCGDPDPDQASASDEPCPQLTVDAVLDIVGHFGFYQKRHYLLVACAWVPCALCTLNMVFVNSRPLWRLPGGDPQDTYLPCGRGDFEIVDPGHSVRGTWGLYCAEDYKAGLLNSAFFVGFAVGAAVLGGLADRIGRRKCFHIAALLSAAASVLSAAAPTAPLYALLRTLVGAGVGGLGIVTFVLASEFIGPSWQAATGVGQAAIFSGGCVLLTPIAYHIRSWRVLTLVTGATPLAFLALYPVIPESPRWLQNQGDVQGCMDVLQRVARANRVPLPPDMELAAPACAPGARPGLGALFRGAMRRRTVVMLFVWFANSFVYYGLSLNAGKLGGSLYFNFALMSGIELLSMPVGACLADRVGRRPTLAGCMVLSGAACALSIALPPGPPTVAAALAGKFGITASFAILFVYAAELFPTVVRSVAMGIASTAARVGGVAAPGVVLLAKLSPPLPLLVFGVAAFVAGVWLLSLPETMGRPLPETMEDCERGAGAPRPAWVELEEASGFEHDDDAGGRGASHAPDADGTDGECY